MNDARRACWLVFPALLVSVAAGCATSGGEPRADLAQSLEAHVNFLASDRLEGRLTGTRGYEIAADYVESQFRQIGLQPAGVVGYRQTVTYAASQIAPEKSSARLHRGGRRIALQWKADWVSGCDPVDPSPRVRAPLTFVGFGVRAPEFGHDDYAGFDVRGRIVVMLQGAPRSLPVNPRAYYSSGLVKRKLAAEQGAVGVVYLRDSYDLRTYDWKHVTRAAGKIPSMYWIGADGTASDYHPELRVLMGVSEGAAERLFEGAPAGYRDVLALEDAGKPVPGFPLRGELEAHRQCAIRSATAPNVLGVLPGSDPALAGEYVVYTAHLDHLGTAETELEDSIYNGAYDNAMGVAAMIESARILAAAGPRRSILFLAVGGEERGLLGSDFFAEHPTVPIADIVANVNLDMPLFLFPLADVVAFGAEHSSLGDVVARAAETEGLKLSPDPMPEEVIFIRSDQYPLVRRGVPAVYLVPGFTSADPSVDGRKATMAFLQTHYHQPSDDLTRPVDWPSAVRFTRINARIGLDVADARGRPRWLADSFFGNLFGRPQATGPSAAR